MRNYSSAFCRKTSRSTCQLFTHPPWAWPAKDLVSFTEDLEVFSSLSTIRDIYLIFLKTGRQKSDFFYFWFMKFYINGLFTFQARTGCSCDSIHRW